MAPDFPYEVAVLRITVAALMTTAWIARHLTDVSGCERIVIPGLCEGDVRVIEDRWGVRTEKGPADLRDLPEHFGQAGAPGGVRRPRHPDLRRDQQRAVPLPRGGGARGGVLSAGRRRRRRPRLLARPEVRRRGRGRQPPQGAGLHPQHRHPRSGRDRRRRPGGRRLRAEPQRAEPGRGRPDPGHAGRHPGLARRSSTRWTGASRTSRRWDAPTSSIR